MRRYGLFLIPVLAVLAMANLTGCIEDAVSRSQHLHPGSTAVCDDDTDCGVGYFCNDNRHCVPEGSSAVCDDNSDCSAGYRCNTNGFCVPVAEPPQCTDNGDCGSGHFCNGNGFCVPSGTTPPPTQECDSNSDCGSGYFCNSLGHCVPSGTTTPDCTVNADCDSNEVCVSGNCVSTSVCDTDADCATNYRCVSGNCVYSPPSPEIGYSIVVKSDGPTVGVAASCSEALSGDFVPFSTYSSQAAEIGAETNCHVFVAAITDYTEVWAEDNGVYVPLKVGISVSGDNPSNTMMEEIAVDMLYGEFGTESVGPIEDWVYVTVDDEETLIVSGLVSF